MCWIVFHGCTWPLPAVSATPFYGLLPSLGVDADGSLSIGEVKLHIRHFAPGWRCSTQGPRVVSGTPVVTRDTWELHGRYLTALDKTSFAMHEKIARAEPGAVSYEARLASPTPIPTQQLALDVLLPIDLFVGVPLEVDGEAFVLPQSPLKKLQHWTNVKRFVVPTPLGRLILEGTLNVQLNDGRNASDKSHFGLRVLFTPDRGDLRESSLSLRTRVEPYGNGQRPSFAADRSVKMEPNAEWAVLEPPSPLEPGSILDWSAMNEKPAGRHGWVEARNGHFELEKRPGRRLRFFGTNLCDRANFLSTADAETLALHLSRSGYNCARIHHYDRHLVKPGCTLAAGWDAEQLDRLDYLVHCLKREGLYITIDLYTVRKVIAGEIAEVDRDVSIHEFKALVAVSPTARANWKEFARRLLTHVNPYTGLAWKDDPAMFGLCLLNEDNTTATWDSGPDIAAVYARRFAEWQRRQSKTERSRDQQWAQFLIETHQAMYRDLSAFLRSLGVRTLLTDANFRQDIATGLVRSELDYVDNHDYHDLKKFLAGPWSLPYGFHQRSAVAEQAIVPRSLFGSRQFGKPYTVTEFNYCYPNHTRAEGGPLIGAYAALQDWDGLFRYAYAHLPERALHPQAIFYLDNAGDPLNLLADRIARLLFLRADVRSAATSVPYLFSDRCFNMPNPLDRPQGRTPAELELLGLVAKIGSVPGAQAAPWAGKAPFAVTHESAGMTAVPGLEVLAPDRGILERFAAMRPELAPHVDASAKRFVSETGEIRLESAAGRLTVITPRTECFVLSGQDTVRGKVAEVRNRGGFAVIALSAMDDRPLAASGRILIIHLTDVQNQGAAFRDAKHTVLTDWGAGPLLVRRGEVDVRLRDAEPSETVVRAVHLSGKPAHAIACRGDRDGVEFTVSTIQPQSSFLVYSLERRKRESPILGYDSLNRVREVNQTQPKHSNKQPKQ